MLKIKFNKKGMAASELAIIILAIVGFGILAPAISYAQQRAEGKSEEIICHNSIAFRSLSTVNFAGQDVKVAPRLCKTIEKDVTGSRGEIKDEIAYKMARCWWMFNEGRHEKVLDNAADILQFLGWSSTDKPCFLCYDLKIDEKEIAEPSQQSFIPAEELFEYMSKKEHRQLKDWKYLDYIQYYGGPGELGILAKIEPQKHYGVVFLPRTTDRGEFLNWADTVIAGTGVVAGSGALGVASVVGAGACFATIGCGVAVVIGGATADASAFYIGAHQLNEIQAFFDQDRPLSSVILTDLKNVEARCQKDLSGE